MQQSREMLMGWLQRNSKVGGVRGLESDPDSAPGSLIF